MVGAVVAASSGRARSLHEPGLADVPTDIFDYLHGLRLSRDLLHDFLLGFRNNSFDTLHCLDEFRGLRHLDLLGRGFGCHFVY